MQLIRDFHERPLTWWDMLSAWAVGFGMAALLMMR